MPKEDVDIDEEIKKLSRKTDLAIQKMEYSYKNKLEKLDKEIDDMINNQLNDFDENKELTSEYLSINYSSSTIDQYREKLKKI